MGHCSLCKGKNPPRTHVFPQNSRPEVQLKWVKAMDLPQEQEDAILTEMRQLEQKGSRPRWCTFHFEYDSAGIHFPKYFDPEEGKTAQGWKEDEEDEDDEEKQGTSKNEDARDRSSTPNEPRRSTRKRTSREPPPASPASSIILDKSIHKILVEAGCIPDKPLDNSPSPSSSKKEQAGTTTERTLQTILMEAGLPVPETLQAKTGLVVDKRTGSSIKTYAAGSPLRFTRPAIANALKNGAQTVGDLKRANMFVPGAGGKTLASPRVLLNPMAKSAKGEWPKVIIPKVAGSNGQTLPASSYNHNTHEKYDEKDSLHSFKMPCQSEDCRSELTVIMNRARALEEQFDDLFNSVHALTQMYKNKTPLAYRPPQSLSTIQGRAASVAGPVYGKPLSQQKKAANINDSLAVQERRERRAGGSVVKKEPERLLTDDDLATTVRKRLSQQEESDEEDEDEEEVEEDSNDDEYRPSKKAKKATSASITSASEASPPRLEMAE